MSPPHDSVSPTVSGTERNELIQKLCDQFVVLKEDWDSLPGATRAQLESLTDFSTLLDRLAGEGLLTRYQVSRISAGRTFGLILGNYRVLDRLGAGGMGVVFRAEHIRMRRLVAVKVLTLLGNENEGLLTRFYSEMRAAAQMNHPHIVGATDAGELPNPDPDGPVLHYFVMEYVSGENLDAYVQQHGPLATATACSVAYQVASALAEAHNHQLVHRDVKPGNIILTADSQAKLLDFGLARTFRRRVTEPGTYIGTLDFMAPEQVRDSSSVDIRADIYGLGGVLFWCLTGEVPFPSKGSTNSDLMQRLHQQPPSVRNLRPEVGNNLDLVISRMLALNADDRYPTPQSVMQALRPYLPASTVMAPPSTALGARGGSAPSAHRRRILVVDDEADVRSLEMAMLQSAGLECGEAANGAEALEALRHSPYDLVLLDVDMPGLSGLEVLEQLRACPPAPHLKIILCSGRTAPDLMAQLLAAGVDDFLTKPLALVQVVSRVKAALRLKESQDRTDALNGHILAANAELERSLSARDGDVVHARNALVLALAKLVERRHRQGGHLARLQHYCRCLIDEAASLPGFAERIDPNFLQALECCAPLHDIGTVALPDHILMKPGKLDAEERLIMQTHTTQGADILAEIARQHTSVGPFLQMAIDVCRHHHERWDGSGYPGGLAGEAIPLADKYQLVIVSCQFDKAVLDLRFVFDAEQKVAGFFFAPSKPPEYKAPAYVQRDAFTDTDVKFGADDWILSGTLSLPKGPGPFPAVVLVHGSGPHDRDETIGPNRPFRDLAWGLASRGIAVLRYEKRTKEHAARMAKLADVTVKEEVLDDALAAVKLLQKTPKVDPKKVFIVGHSLGAMLAPRLGELDPSLAGLVLLAGPTRPIEELLLEQYLYLAELNEVPLRTVDAIKEQLAKLRAAKPDTPAAELPLGVPLSYWRSLHQADPTKIAPKLTLPLLLLQGERDYQVTMTDFTGWQKLLKGRKNAELKSYPKLNHLLIAGAGKSKPAEYQQEGHVDKEIIDDIAAWVKKQ